ncbi:MAG: FtsW/RodA/SpoVE family cell cycle protein [Anaerolineae bacterium]|nr:FtsW/RodA/SpoVE family cell cycle protein [Anaerolineae bacterium]
MGESTYVRPLRTDRSGQPHPLKLHMDVPLVLAVVTLVLFGLLMVYSASWDYFLTYTDLGEDYIISRQVLWALLGLVIAFAISRVDYRRYTKLVVVAMLLTLGLLAFVAMAGRVPGLPSRSVFTSGSGQPSEFAKLMIVIYLSVWINARKDTFNNLSLGMVPLTAIIGITAGLILIQPDFSAAFTVVILGGVMFFLAGGDLRKIFIILLGTAAFGSLVVLVVQYAQNRLLQFWKGLLSPLEANYQVLRSIEAVARGGVFGVGIGNSVTKANGLPVPWTDSIYAVIVEETGLVGGLIVLGLFLLIAWRGFRIAQRTPDFLGKLLASGITFWITFEALVNIGVILNLIPVLGNPLPFISAGGSSMLATMTGVGILLSINRQTSLKNFSSEGRSFSAVINLRRGDGRGRVPRASRRRGARAR